MPLFVVSANDRSATLLSHSTVSLICASTRHPVWHRPGPKVAGSRHSMPAEVRRPAQPRGLATFGAHFMRRHKIGSPASFYGRRSLDQTGWHAALPPESSFSPWRDQCIVAWGRRFGVSDVCQPPDPYPAYVRGPVIPTSAAARPPPSLLRKAAGMHCRPPMTRKVSTSRNRPRHQPGLDVRVRAFGKRLRSGYGCSSIALIWAPGWWRLVHWRTRRSLREPSGAWATR